MKMSILLHLKCLHYLHLIIDNIIIIISSSSSSCSSNSGSGSGSGSSSSGSSTLFRLFSYECDSKWQD
jgi:hypothetical protein